MGGDGEKKEKKEIRMIPLFGKFISIFVLSHSFRRASDEKKFH
jgi:hypothetical protein